MSKNENYLEADFFGDKITSGLAISWRKNMVEEGGILKKQLLGEILVKRRIISPVQLDYALDAQKKDGGYLGEILIRLGYLEDRDIVTALVVQCNLPYIAVDKYEIDSHIIQLIPEEMARKEAIIPLDRVGNVLSVVMSNPLDIAVKAELHRMTNFQIVPFIATRAEILKAIDRCYKKG